MDNSLESEIISTIRHLNALITTYVLVEDSVVLAYYSDLCNKLEKLANMIERNKKNDRKRETDCK